LLQICRQLYPSLLALVELVFQLEPRLALELRQVLVAQQLLEATFQVQ
jgi:hypothetical protein